jgi:hypothetical protein
MNWEETINFMRTKPEYELLVENTFSPTEYKNAIQNAGLAVLKELRYYDSPINYTPDTEEMITAKITAHTAHRFQNLAKKIGFLAKIGFIKYLYTQYLNYKKVDVLNEILDEKLMMSIIKPPVYGLEMYNTLKNSKLSLNIHIDKAKNEAANMRLFEITGAGSCMVTDWKENLTNIFVEDEEIVVFKTFEEAKDKIKMLLKDDKLRNKIALAGQKRTLNDYKFSNKIKWLDKIIQENIPN